MTAHWISPFRADKNLGLAINEAVERLRITCSPEDWVVLTDQDILFLQPDTKAHILEILGMTSYELLGCVTNRLGEMEQRVAGMFAEDSITRHVATADAVWQQRGHEVGPADAVAGMMMCFRISTWMRVGGFNENRLNFDTMFSWRVRKMGGKVGLMRGIYVFHLYRWGAVDPRNSFKHLQV